jgi:hypothetical protein
MLPFSGHKIESSWKKGNAMKEQKIGTQAVGSMSFEKKVFSMGQHE